MENSNRPMKTRSMTLYCWIIPSREEMTANTYASQLCSDVQKDGKYDGDSHSTGKANLSVLADMISRADTIPEIIRLKLTIFDFPISTKAALRNVHLSN